MSARPRIGRLFWTFLKIGSTSWGGFMPLIAVVQNYMSRSGTLGEEEVSDVVFVAQVLPGPVAVNFCAGIGYRIAGIAGALACWTAVLIPTFVLVLVLSVMYFRYGAIPAVGHIFAGIVPAVVAIIFSAALAMGRKNVNTVAKGAIALVALVALLLSQSIYTTLAVVLVSALAGYVLFRTPAPAAKVRSSPVSRALNPLPIAWFFVVKPAIAGKLFVTFALLSVTLFGGGYVFIPIVQSLVVDSAHWLTRREFVDGIALGQVTPGPIMITAAFVGYKVAGLLGAFAATLGMFGPPAILMTVAIHFLGVWKRWPWVNAALQGVRPAVVGMLLAAAWYVGRTTDWTWIGVLIFIAALVAIVRYKAEVAAVIPLAGIAGFAVVR